MKQEMEAVMQGGTVSGKAAEMDEREMRGQRTRILRFNYYWVVLQEPEVPRLFRWQSDAVSELNARVRGAVPPPVERS